LWHYPGIYKEGMWETTKCQVRIVHVPAGIWTKRSTYKSRALMVNQSAWLGYAFGGNMHTLQEACKDTYVLLVFF
jgi:hypothetical protein